MCKATEQELGTLDIRNQARGTWVPRMQKPITALEDIPRAEQGPRGSECGGTPATGEGGPACGLGAQEGFPWKIKWTQG